MFLLVGAILTACVDGAPELPLAPVEASFAVGGIPTVVVNSLLDDVIPGTPGAPLCSPAKCTFRQALDEVPSGGKITFSDNLCSGAPSCEIHGSGFLVANDSLNPDPNYEVTINGPTAYALTIRGSPNATHSVLWWACCHVTIRNLAITGNTLKGLAAENSIGGGILSSDYLTLENVRVYGNFAEWGGGGIFHGGVLEIRNSDITGNVTDGKGAGIYLGFNGLLLGGRATLINTNVSGNRGTSAVNQSRGGGIYLFPNTSAILAKKSCISGNTPDQYFLDPQTSSITQPIC